MRRAPNPQTRAQRAPAGRRPAWWQAKRAARHARRRQPTEGRERWKPEGGETSEAPARCEARQRDPAQLGAARNRLHVNNTAENTVQDLQQAQHDRLPIAKARAEAKLASVIPNAAAERLLSAARKAGTGRQRVLWLQRTASAWAQPLERVAACRQGCDACCSIPLTITQAEADLIGAHAGLVPAHPKVSVEIPKAEAEEAQWNEAQQKLRAAAPGGTCPFLVNSACSIYEHRPFGCRIHLNLDDDSLLCQRIDGVDTDVPLANNMLLKAYYLGLQPSARLADIRHFFPAKPAS